MRKQQQIWEQEYQTAATLPALSRDLEPSSAVLYFTDYLKTNNILPPKNILDIGSGAGRNALHFAKMGFDVIGMEFITDAINLSEKRAAEQNLSERIKMYQMLIDDTWPFEDRFFDMAIDCFSSIDIETKEGREIYKNELFRTLQPQGYALISVVSTEDDWEKELLTTSPGNEKNSTIWPSGKFQKNYDENELREFYKNFTIIDLKKISKPAKKLGKDYMATNFWMIVQKP
jgi:SAM-dependent methyltransferase